MKEEIEDLRKQLEESQQDGWQIWKDAERYQKMIKTEKDKWYTWKQEMIKMRWDMEKLKKESEWEIEKFRKVNDSEL